MTALPALLQKVRNAIREIEETYTDSAVICVWPDSTVAITNSHSVPEPEYYRREPHSLTLGSFSPRAEYDLADDAPSPGLLRWDSIEAEIREWAEHNLVVS